MKRTTLFTILLGLMPFYLADTAQAQPSIVLELFTSQGCSSCPPADSLLRSLATNPDILPLSLHVHYWDYLGWKDPYSSQDNTERQRAYAKLLHDRGVYTPQLVANGSFPAVGSDQDAVKTAIENAKAVALPIAISITPAAAKLAVHISALPANIKPIGQATVYAMPYTRNTTTDVKAGENSGETLRSINNVSEIRILGNWDGNPADFTTAFDGGDNNGIAILIQRDELGPIVAAATYNP